MTKYITTLFILLLLVSCDPISRGKVTTVGKIVSYGQQHLHCEDSLKIRLLQGYESRIIRVSEFSKFNLYEYLNKNVEIVYEHKWEPTFGTNCFVGKILSIKPVRE